MSKSTEITKVLTNRRNARRSTGPKTAKGKSITSRNAMRHGMLSWKPVLPNVEDARDWDRHLEHILVDLAPASYMETILAERVALLLWRLARVARCEREAGAVLQETAETAVAEARQLRQNRFKTTADESEYPDDAASDLEDAKQRCERLARFTSLSDDAPLRGADAIGLLDDLAETAGIDLYADGFPVPASIPDGTCWEDYDGWNAGMIRAALAEIAIQAESSPADLLANTVRDAEVKMLFSTETNRRLQTELDQYRRTHLLPDGETLDRINRYETTLERSLSRTLHELQRMQATRKGHIVPPPIAVDVDLSGARS